MATPLLKWYLEHGLEVTRVHQVIEFTPEPCFKPFRDAVSDARGAGDADPRKAIIADTMKLVSFLFQFLDYRGGNKASFIGNKLIQVFSIKSVFFPFVFRWVILATEKPSVTN